MAVLFARRVSEYTQGEVAVQIFPGGMLGGTMQNTQGLKTGSNDFAAQDPGVLSLFDPSKQVAALQLPYMFDDYTQGWAFMDSDRVKGIFEPLPRTAGLRVLAVWENGMEHMINKRRPITRPSDFQGLKLRSVNDPVMVYTLKTLGANPTVMDFSEVYSALQQGVVDGLYNTIANIYNGKFYEVQKYMSFTKHQYSGLAFFMSEIGWNRVSSDQRTAITKAATEVRVIHRQRGAAFETEYIKAMVAKGITTNSVPDLKPFREAVVPVYTYHEGVLGKEVIRGVLDTAAKIRAQYPATCRTGLPCDLGLPG
jgi:tripartite ATP-independent transporter DctP family solute receptor